MTTFVKEGEDIVIPKSAKHRVKALNDERIILEISYGKFDENDIIRLEDDFHRTTVSKTTVTSL